MTFFAYWERKKKVNPALSDGGTKMTISVEQFRKELEKCWHIAKAEGVKDKPEFEKFMDQLMRKV